MFVKISSPATTILANDDYIFQIKILFPSTDLSFYLLLKHAQTIELKTITHSMAADEEKSSQEAKKIGRKIKWKSWLKTTKIVMIYKLLFSK